MDDTATIILAVVAGLAILGAIYLVTRPAPKADVSLDEVAQLAAMVAAYW